MCEICVNMCEYVGKKSTIIGFCGKYTLASYVPKKARAVILLSFYASWQNNNRRWSQACYHTPLQFQEGRSGQYGQACRNILLQTKVQPLAVIVVLQHRRRLLHCCTCNLAMQFSGVGKSGAAVVGYLCCSWVVSWFKNKLLFVLQTPELCKVKWEVLSSGPTYKVCRLQWKAPKESKNP